MWSKRAHGVGEKILQARSTSGGLLRGPLHSRIDAPGAIQAAIASRSWRAAKASNAAASLARVKFAMSLMLEPQRARHMPDHLASGSTVAITPRPSLNSRPFHTTFILRRDLQHIANFFRGVRRQRQYIRGAVRPQPTQRGQEQAFRK